MDEQRQVKMLSHELQIAVLAECWGWGPSDVRDFSPSTRRRYSALASRTIQLKNEAASNGKK